MYGIPISIVDRTVISIPHEIKYLAKWAKGRTGVNTGRKAHWRHGNMIV